MTPGEVVVILGVSAAVYGARRAGEAKTKPRGPKRPRGSLLVKFYNSASTEPVKSATASEAAAELAGRRTGRTWRTVKTASGRRWERRAATRPSHTAADRWRTVARQAKAEYRRRRQPRLAEGGKPPGGGAKPTPSAPIVPVPSAPPPRSAPAPPPQPHREPAPARPAKGPHMPETATDTGTTDAPATTAPAAPPLWAMLADGALTFVPEDDASLIQFMSGEVAGVLAYAAALEQTRENCTNEVGLDPAAVAGFTGYSEAMSEAAERMAEAQRQFTVLYAEVLELAASGVVLPHNGRWFTGAAT